jgi:hypothetical protein
MKKQQSNCKNVMQHICESLGEELNSERCLAIKQHLDDCPNCQTYFKTVELTIDFYKKYDADLPDGAHDRLMSFLDLNDCEEK